MRGVKNHLNYHANAGRVRIWRSLLLAFHPPVVCPLCERGEKSKNSMFRKPETCPAADCAVDCREATIECQPTEARRKCERGRKNQNPLEPCGLRGFCGINVWGLRDSNPRPSRCKRDALTS